MDPDVDRQHELHYIHKKRRQKRLKDSGLTKGRGKKNGVLHTSEESSELNSGITEKIRKRIEKPSLQDAFTKWSFETHQHNPYVKYYAITISPHGRHEEKAVVTNSIYSLFNLYKGVISSMYIYEKSKLGKWHIHGLLAMKDKCKFAKVRKHPLVKYHIVEYVPGEWIDYISKDLPSQVYQVNRYEGTRVTSITRDIRDYIDWL